MSQKIIGREDEQKVLDKLLTSKKAEFLAIYGRRRVGKTLLIREYFKEKKDIIFINFTGTLHGSMRDQISNFVLELSETFYSGVALAPPKNWNEAFRILNDAINSRAFFKKIVLFFDEFPWMATPNSKLLQSLEYIWNHDWSFDHRIKLIICGSSASWIINKIIRNKGGLHNRITQTIHLEPYNLRDTKRFLNHQGIKLNNQQITQLYMAIGGIPYYLSYIEKGLSAAENLENLAFKRKSFFLEEFNNLFSALFEEPDLYIDILRAIAKCRYGISQDALFKKINNLSKGGRAAEKLKALEDASFIIRFKPYSHSKKGIYYKLIDEYTLFYFHWIEPFKETLLTKSTKKNYWENIQNSPEWYSWAGYAFEALCYKHLAQISEALQMSPTALASTWRQTSTKLIEQGAQIDLLFDRKDNAITLCEIKYTVKPFEINKQYATELNRKVDVFTQVTKTCKQIFLNLITANGLKKNMYSDMIEKVVTLEDLFKKE